MLRSLLDWISHHSRGFYAAIGAYLAIGLGVSVAALLVFGLLATLVAEGVTQRMDEAILLWMYEHSSPWLDKWAMKLTALGSTVVVVMMVVVSSALLWMSRHRWSVALLWVAMLGSAVLSSTLKAAFDRPRPELWERSAASAASFPSGHAMSAVVIYGTLAYLVARIEEGPKMRRVTLGVAAFVILIIGTTRLYLGVHYPSDVIAGYAVALGWATFCALGIEAVRYFAGRKPEIARGERDLAEGIEPITDALHRHDGHRH